MCWQDDTDFQIDQIHAAGPAPQVTAPDVTDLTGHIELPEYGPHRPRHWKATCQTPLDHCDAGTTNQHSNNVLQCVRLLVTHMATYKHTCIHLYIYLLTSLYLSCFANSYQCWQAIIDKDQAELQAKGLHLPKVIALPHATNIGQWIQSTRLGHSMNARLKRIREYEETFSASIPYAHNPRQIQDGINRKTQKLHHWDGLQDLDLTLADYTRLHTKKHNLGLRIAREVDWFFSSSWRFWVWLTGACWHLICVVLRVANMCVEGLILDCMYVDIIIPYWFATQYVQVEWCASCTFSHHQSPLIEDVTCLLICDMQSVTSPHATHAMYVCGLVAACMYSVNVVHCNVIFIHVDCCCGLMLSCSVVRWLRGAHLCRCVGSLLYKGT